MADIKNYVPSGYAAAQKSQQTQQAVAAEEQQFQKNSPWTKVYETIRNRVRTAKSAPMGADIGEFNRQLVASYREAKLQAGAYSHVQKTRQGKNRKEGKA